jgi:hypothetical protein
LIVPSLVASLVSATGREALRAGTKETRPTAEVTHFQRFPQKKMIFLLVASLVSAQDAPTGMPELPAACTQALQTAVGASGASCGTILQGVQQGNIPTVNGVLTDLNNQLKAICSTECTSVLRVVSAELAKPACSSASFASGGVNITAGTISSLVPAVVNVMCIKDGDAFCLAKQAAQLAPLANSTSVAGLTPLLSDTAFLCQECTRKEVKAISEVVTTLPAELQPLSATINQVLKSVTDKQATCPAPSPTAKSSAEMMSAGSGLAAAFLAWLL